MPSARRVTAGGAIIVSLAAGAVALATPATAAPTGRHVVKVHVSGNTAHVKYASTRPGWTRIRNTGATPLLVLRGTGRSAAALANDYNHHKYSAIRRHFPIATSVDQRSDAYARLKHGEYFVIAGYHRGTWKTSQIGTLGVHGSKLNSPLPRANTMTVDKHGVIHAASTMRRLRYAKLVHHSSTSVNMLAIAIDESTSQAAITRFLAHPSLNKLGTLSARPTATLAQACAQGGTIYNPEYLRAGREMLISFHSFHSALHHGQAKLVTVH